MPSTDHTNHSVPIIWLGRWTALLVLILMSSTWPLWLGKGEFPAIPLIGGLHATPLWVDRVCLVGLLGGLLSSLIVGNQRTIARRFAWGFILVCSLALVALDQHRLQPWFYQLIFFSAILCFCQSRYGGELLQWIVVSIYFFSALGKFDFEFLHTVGQQFWNESLRWVGGNTSPETPTSIYLICLLPIAELVLALGLAFRPTRWVAGGLACIFHILLMLVLGPVGLHHSWGVFWWNLQFAGQACLLFVWPQIQAQLAIAQSSALGSSVDQRTGRTHEPVVDRPSVFANKRTLWAEGLATCIAVLVMVLPAVERLGYWDHWTSWALYAPHSSRVEVWIASSAVDKLPPSLQQLLTPEQEHEALWVRLPIERWSLTLTGSPIYPQSRFQLGIAQALAQHTKLEFGLKAIVRGVAARWDGKRWTREFEGANNITRAAQTLYWLSTQPRQ